MSNMTFPQPEDTKLLEEVRETMNVAQSFSDWMSNYRDARFAAQHSFSEETFPRCLRLRTALQNLERAACTPPACALYGASQSGKSAMVASIFRDNGTEAHVLGNKADGLACNLSFARDMNPTKAGEATAVVTRFTLCERLHVGQYEASAPVKATLFSESDLLKAWGQGFFSECKGDRIFDEDQLTAIMDDLRNHEQDQDVDESGLTLSLCEAYRYLKEDLGCHRFNVDADRFSRQVHEGRFSEGAIIDLAAALFWDSWDTITKEFLALLARRRKSMFRGGEVWLSWQATHFILDTARADTFAGADIGFAGDIHWDNVSLQEQDGRPTLGYSGTGSPANYALMQGLISEVSIPVSPSAGSLARSLLESGDLLDVPGAVSEAGRAAMDEQALISNDLDAFHILKRGKVGLLFEKYAQERQSSSLVYVQRFDGVVAARSVLVPQINLWGKRLLGKEWPDNMNEDEAESPSIFMALTNIEALLNLPPNPATATERFREFGNFFSWFNNYGARDKPFTNVFWIRYPGTWDATTPPDGHIEWRRLIASNDLVKAHTGNTEERWDKAMQDGGAGEMLSAAFAKLRPEPRRLSLHRELHSLKAQLSQMMRSLYVDPSSQAEANSRRVAAAEVLDWLKEDPYGERTRHLLDKLRVEIDSKRLRSRNGKKDELLADTLKGWLTGTDWTLTLEGESKEFDQFARYLYDYLKGPCVDQLQSFFDDTMSALPAKAPSHILKRYSEMVINDYLITPGQRDDAHPDTFSTVGTNDPHLSFIDRWDRLLAERLASAVEDGGIPIPAGNDELKTILDGFEQL
jgi:hypothetical protein